MARLLLVLIVPLGIAAFLLYEINRLLQVFHTLFPSP